MWYTYIPNMKSVQASHLEISCLQAGHHKHTHIHARMTAKVTIIIETKKTLITSEIEYLITLKQYIDKGESKTYKVSSL